MKRAKQTVRDILVEAKNVEDEKERKALVGHAFKSERKDRLNALVSLATSESGIGITPDALDSNPWLLNAENGTINLRDGSLQPHQRTDYLTKILPVSYCPYATCPQWEAFLWRVLAEDQALYDFLQRAVGYALTGDTSEQCLFILYGFGQNGKSTFLEVLMDLLREYARQADFGTFLQKTQDAVRNDLARLVGMRIVAAVEADEGKRLSEAVVKQITGGDTITARFLYSEFFDYRPQFKIFLGTNHKPVIKGTDHAIWRRIRLIPFQVTIPKEEQNKHLKDELREELPGILAWAVQGCLEWQRIGLDPPAAVQQATEGYRSEMDVIGSFIADRCVVADYASIQSTSLYKTYEQWCEDNGEKPIAQRELSLRIQERGFDKKHKNTGTFWEGIGLDQVEDSPGF